MASAARWLAPSAVAASAGAIAGGVLEARRMDGVFGTIAAAGFFALGTLPVVLVASIAWRGLWAAWQPRQLGLIDEDGSAPRLAGWIGMLVLGAAGLAWAMFQGTWLLAAWTAFKPLSLSFAEPMLAIAATLALVIVSRPLARAIAALVRWVDARWRKGGRRSLVTPRRIALFASIKVAAICALMWWFVIRRRLGAFDTSVFYAPLATIAVTAGVHAAWARFATARRIGGAIVGLCTALLLGCAMYAWRAEPSLTLAIWGEQPVAGFTIDRLFDLDSIRAGVSLAEFQPGRARQLMHPISC